MYKYVTIEREYGSGGTEISQKLAELTGIPAYGYEILEKVAEEYKIPISQITQYEEKSTNSFIYSMYMMSKIQSGETDLISKEGGIFIAEQNMIKKLASYGPAIFLGRCSCEALKDMKNVLHVFIRAEKDFKVKRSIDVYNIDPDDAESVVKTNDKRRSSYYRTNTGKTWDNVKNYDIVLDSSSLGIDGCVQLLASVLKN